MYGILILKVFIRIKTFFPLPNKFSLLPGTLSDQVSFFEFHCFYFFTTLGKFCHPSPTCSFYTRTLRPYDIVFVEFNYLDDSTRSPTVYELLHHVSLQSKRQSTVQSRDQNNDSRFYASLTFHPFAVGLVIG